jgi:hypothetical protein
MGDELYRQYSTLLKCWKCAVLSQNLSHNLIKSEKIIYLSSIKFEITINLKQFYWVIQNDCEYLSTICTKMYVATV